MKKPLGKKHLLFSFLGGAIFFSGISYAADLQVTPNTEPLNFYMDGEARKTSATFDNQGTMVPQSFVYNGTTYVPIRHMSELMGHAIYWDGPTSTISVGSPVVQVKDSQGKSIGTITLTQQDDGVLARINVSNLPPGKHGFHVHQSPISGNDFATAGSHFNPTGQEHGHLNPNGVHVGDFQNLEVAADGTAQAELKLEDASLTKGDPHSILGTSLIIHANEDDQKTDPSGNSGDRIAGGNIPQ